MARNNKTYDSTLIDISTIDNLDGDNESAANALFGFGAAGAGQKAPEPQSAPAAPQAPVSDPAPAPVQSQPALVQPEPQPAPQQNDPADVPQQPKVPLSVSGMAKGPIMGDDSVDAEALFAGLASASTGTPAPQPAPVPAAPAPVSDPAPAPVQPQPAPAQSAPQPGAQQTVYRSPLQGTISMDGGVVSDQQNAPCFPNQVQQSPGGTGMPGGFGTATKGVNPNQRIVPDPSLGRQTYGIGQQPSGYSYVSDTLQRPQSNFKTFQQQFVSVHSPKGGVGKSTIAKELAWAFALGEVNGQKLKVLLVDCDYEFGDQSMLFNVNPSPCMSNWANQMRKDLKETGKIPRYDKQTIKRFVLPITENLDLLAATQSPLDEKLITVDMVKAMCANLRSCDYDVVIFDNSNTIKDERNYAILEASDVIFEIDTLDMTTISEIGEMIETMRNKSFDLSKIKLVVNTVPADGKELDITPQQVVDAYELDFSVQIPEYDKVRRNNNAAEAEMWNTKDTPYTKAIKKMANDVLPVYPEKKKGLFSKLFGRK